MMILRRRTRSVRSLLCMTLSDFSRARDACLGSLLPSPWPSSLKSEASQGLRDKFVVVADIDSILSSVNYGGIGSMAGTGALKESMELQKRRTKGCCYESLFERCYEGILLGLVVA
jgi:hypothetical protein